MPSRLFVESARRRWPLGAFTDPTFPPPMISGFEAYGHPWAMNPSDLPIPHHDYDGTSQGGPRA
jgi:hypothetical protein